MTPALRAFAVRCTWFPGHEAIVIARTSGEAKARKWQDIRESWDTCPFTTMRARVLDGYHEPENFRRVVEYRGIPWAKVGMRVRGEGMDGVIVGANDSCNLNVRSDGDGVTYNVHPLFEVTYFADDGSVFAEVKRGVVTVRAADGGDK